MAFTERSEERGEPSASFSSRSKQAYHRPPDYLWRHLVDAEKFIGWNKNAILHRLVFRKLEDGWQAIVKARRGNQFGCAYVNGRTFPDCLELLSLGLAEDSLDWKTDKYPPTN